MKKIAVIIFLLSSLFAGAQKYLSYDQYGAKYNRFDVAKTLHIPAKDTLLLESNNTRPGALIFYTKDSSIYTWTGTQFIKVTGSGGGGGTWGSITGTLSSQTDLQNALNLKLNKADSTAMSGYATQYDLTQISGGGPADSSWLSTETGKQEVGLRRFYNFKSNPFTGEDNTPNTTVTADGSKTKLSGGALNFNNYIGLADSISSHNWTIEGRVVAVQKSNSTSGFAISLAHHYAGASLYGYAMLADTAGYIALNESAVIPTTNSTSSTRGNYLFKWNAGDTLKYKITRVSYLAEFTLINTNTGATLSIQNNVQTAPGSLRIYAFGGEWDFLDSIKVIYHDAINPKIAVGGNSITSGLTASTESKRGFVTAFDGVRYVQDYSSGAARAATGLFTLNDVLANKPEYYLYLYTLNDVGASVNIDTIKAQVLRFIDPLISAGVKVIIGNTLPISSYSVQVNDTLRSIANARSLPYIDLFTQLKNPASNTIAGEYNWGDNVHLNDAGNFVWGKTIRRMLDSLGITNSTSIVKNSLDGIPTAPRVEYILGLDKYGFLKKETSGTNSSYLRLWNFDNVGGAYNSGNTYLKGNAWFSSMRIGQTPQSYGQGSALVAESIQSIGGITGGDLYAGTNPNRIHSVPNYFYIVGKQVNISNTSYFQTESIPFYISRNIPQNGGKIGIRHNALTTGGGEVQADWKNFQFEIGGTAVMWADRKGGIHADSVHQYNGDYESLILANARNIPDVGAMQKVIGDTATVLRGLIGSGGGVSDGDKGDITVSGSGATWSIDNGTVGLSKMADIATASLIGRNTAGTGAPEVLAASTVKSLLSINLVDNTSDATKNSATATLTNKTLTAPVISSIVNTGTLTLPTVTGTIAQYVTNSTTSSATPAPTGDARDNRYNLTALATAPTFSAPSGTATDGNTLLIRIKDNGTARALTWNAIYRGGTQLALPTTTIISKTMYVQFVYNSTDTKWDLIGLTDGL